MLACCVAANLWMDFSVSWDILSSNVICITFGLPLIPMSCIQDIVQYPKFKATMFNVFIKEDYIPCVLGYLQCGSRVMCHETHQCQQSLVLVHM